MELAPESRSAPRTLRVTLSVVMLVSVLATAGMSGLPTEPEQSGMDTASTDDGPFALSVSHTNSFMRVGADSETAFPGIETDRRLMLNDGANYHFRLTNEDTGESVRLAFNGTAKVGPGDAIGFNLYRPNGSPSPRPLLWVTGDDTDDGFRDARVVSGTIPEATGMTNFSVAVLDATTDEVLARTESSPHLLGYTGTFSKRPTSAADTIEITVPRNDVPKAASAVLTLRSEDSDDRERFDLTYDATRDAFTTAVRVSNGSYSLAVTYYWRDSRMLYTSGDPFAVGEGSDGDRLDGTAAATLAVDPADRRVSPGESVELTYTLTNVGSEQGSGTAIEIDGLPDDWTITSESSDWQQQAALWLRLDPLAVGEQYRATATVTVPENASDGEYVVTARGSLAPEVADEATTIVTVSGGFSPETYDTDGDGSVEGDIDAVLQGISDYNDGKITLEQVLQLIEAYNGN